MKFPLVDLQLVISDIISGLVVAAITAFFGIVIAKKYLSRLSFSNKMKELGFLNTSTEKLSQNEIKHMCRKAEVIKIIYVSGVHFFKNNEILLKKALDKGIKIQFLCCNPNSVFLHDIEKMENNAGLRKKEDKISDEITDLIKNYKDSGIEMRFYSTEYRMPFVMASYKDGSMKAWLTMTLPPYKSTKSFVLRGEKKPGVVYDKEINFVDMMENHFDAIWENSSPLNEQEGLIEDDYKAWMDLYNKAKDNMKATDGRSGVLIEVAAQHPLIDGEFPNEEFEKRLLKSIQLYKEKTEQGEKVYIYVPGSVHMNGDVKEKVSLSEAGVKFLLDHGIPKDSLFGDEMNKKYKGDDGVYNSPDECYVASRIFMDNRYKELNCVCSPGQMTRKVLSYLKFGCIPYVHTVSCDEMYHNYIYEIFRNIPDFLNDGNALQGDSAVAKEIRNIRCPK